MKNWKVAAPWPQCFISVWISYNSDNLIPPRACLVFAELAISCLHFQESWRKYSGKHNGLEHQLAGSWVRTEQSEGNFYDEHCGLWWSVREASNCEMDNWTLREILKLIFWWISVLRSEWIALLIKLDMSTPPHFRTRPFLSEQFTSSIV